MRLHVYSIPNISDILTSPGNPIAPVFTPRFNGSEIVLEESGSVDIQERINSYAPYCDIRYMLNQLRFGDRSALNPKEPLYGDFSGMPSHPVDALNFIDDVQRSFERFPDELKKDCNNDWRVYLTKLVTGKLNDRSVLSDKLQDSDLNIASTDVKEV